MATRKLPYGKSELQSRLESTGGMRNSGGKSKTTKKATKKTARRKGSNPDSKVKAKSDYTGKSVNFKVNRVETTGKSTAAGRKGVANRRKGKM